MMIEIVSFSSLSTATIVKETFLQHTNTTVYMATKLGSMISYLDWYLAIKLLNPSITSSYKITWQTKTTYNIQHTMRSSHSQSYMILPPCGLVKSHDISYLHLHTTNSHKHGKVCGDILQGTPTQTFA